jgi:hypothetical protein
MVLRLELRALCLLGWRSATCTTKSSSILLSIFQLGFLEVFVGLPSKGDPHYLSSSVARIIGMSHMHLALSVAV